MIQHGADAMSERLQEMTPNLYKQHEKAFEHAQDKAKGTSTNALMPQYICENDRNEHRGYALSRPRGESTKVAATRAKKMDVDIKQKPKPPKSTQMK